MTANTHTSEHTTATYGEQPAEVNINTDGGKPIQRWATVAGGAALAIPPATARRAT